MKFEKSNPQNRNLQTTSPKNKQISSKTSPKTSNPQVHKKISPNSRENRKVGNTAAEANCETCVLIIFLLDFIA